MKKIYTLVFLALIVLVNACSNSDKKVEEKKLIGKYSVDLSDVQKIIDNGVIDLNEASRQMVGKLLQQADLTVDFSESDVNIDVSQTVSLLLSAVSQDKFSFPITAKYKIENDTIVYLQDKEEFKEVGILKTVDGNYDNLVFVPNKYGVEINLRRE